MPEKKLKSSLKERKRYLLIEARKEGTSEDQIRKSLESTISEFAGNFGIAKACLKIIRIKEEDKIYRIILSVNREAVELVRASFEVGNNDFAIKRVSGTIRGLN